MLPSVYAQNRTRPSQITKLRLDLRDDRTTAGEGQNQEFTKWLERTFASNLPSFPLDSPFENAQHYKSVIYLGIQFLMDAMSGATCQLEKKRRGKGRARPGAKQGDADYVPYEDHPLADILKHPNPVDTFTEFLIQSILQYSIFGDLLIWDRPNEFGAPVRLYVLPTALCTPAYGLNNSDYPKGAWRIQQYYPASGMSPILGPLAGLGGAIIDARQVTRFKNPHPMYRWAPYSPFMGIDDQLSILEMVDRSCMSTLRNGVKPSGVFDMPGAGPDQIAAVQDAFRGKAGPDHAGEILVVGGGRPDRPAGAFSNTIPTPDVMQFGEQWERYAGFILAAAFGIDLTVVGLSTKGSYSERYAAIQDVRDRKIVPWLGRFANALTDGAVKKWGLLDKGCRCSVILPPLKDPTLIAEMCRDAASDSTMTVNEIRALRGLEPVKVEKPDGTSISGNLPPKVFEQMLLSATQPQQPQMPGQGGPPGSGPEGDEDDTGLEDGSEKTPMPGQGQNGDGPNAGAPPTPPNPAGAGSLPPRQMKAFLDEKGPNGEEVEWVLTGSISVNASDLQYKDWDGSADGLNEERRAEITRHGKFDPNTTPPIALWQNPDDHQIYVVDGHKRLASARFYGSSMIRGYFIEAGSFEEAKKKGERLNRKLGTKAFDSKIAKALMTEIAKASEEDLSGLMVFYREKGPQVWVDQLDWHDGKLGGRLIELAEKLLGVEARESNSLEELEDDDQPRLYVSNEGPNPTKIGEGWKDLIKEATNGEGRSVRSLDRRGRLLSSRKAKRVLSRLVDAVLET